MEGLRARVLGAMTGIAAVAALGASGYYFLGDGKWSFSDCLYMTIITLGTVGYGETLDGFTHVPYTREYTMLLIIVGIGTFLYFASNLTATIIGTDIRSALKQQRMRKQMSKLKNHVIVCGGGKTGQHILAELIALRVEAVVIDQSQEAIDDLISEFGEGKFKYLVGDATEDHVLADAALDSARGLCAALANDKDNLYLVVTTRQTNSTARIVARGSDLGVLEKLRRAGADSVVSPNYIGGLRMVSEMIRPTVTQFLDEMMRTEDRVRIAEIAIPDGSPAVGRVLRETGIRRDHNVLVIALKRADGTGFVYGPSPDTRLEAQMTLVVLGATDKVSALRDEFAAS